MKIFFAGLACVLSLSLVASAGEPIARPVNPYPGETVIEMLAKYARLTGKKVICDPNVNGPAFLVYPPDITDEKKAELIEKQIFLNGFALIDSGEDVVEVLGVGKQVRCAGLPLYTKPEELPRGERIVSYVFKLEHRNPAVIAAVLGQYFLPSNQNGFMPDPESRTLIVSGQTSIIRAIIKMMPLLDVAVAPAQKEAAAPVFPRLPTPIRPIPQPKGDDDDKKDQ